MPFPIPTLDDLRTRTRQQFAARLPGADTTLPVSFLGVNADTIAAEDFAEYRAVVWLARQLFLDSCESGFLNRFGAEYGIPRFASMQAAGSVTFAGTSGVTIPSGTLLQNSLGTVAYATSGAATLAAGTATASVLSVSGAAAANAAAGAPLTLSSAIAGVQPTAVVGLAGLTGGTDLEADASYRARLLLRRRTPPQGGAATDYLAWAKDFYAGVTRAWVFPLNRGRGTVDVYFTMDGRANPIPLAADVAAVQAAINLVRPVTADVLVLAPVPQSQAVSIGGLVPDDAATQAAVVAQLGVLLASVAPGGASIGDGVSALYPGGMLYLSQIEAAIQAAGDVLRFDLLSPAADVSYGAGVILQLGSVTFA